MGQSPSKWDHYGPSPHPESLGDLSPLSPQYRGGFIAIGTLAILSFVSCICLFLFITLRLVQFRMLGGGGGARHMKRNHHHHHHHHHHRRQQSLPFYSNSNNNNNYDFDPAAIKPSEANTTTSSGTKRADTPGGGGRPGAADSIFSGSSGSERAAKAAAQAATTNPPNLRSAHSLGEQQQQQSSSAGQSGGQQGQRGFNPLLILIYMLLAADILQSGSLVLNLEWVRRDAIVVRSDTCRAQGWLRSQGDLSSSLFAAAIAAYTYLAVVRGRSVGCRAVLAVSAAIWLFSTFIVGAGVWASRDGAGRGGYWARVDTWCWISQEFATTRIWGHFVWVLSGIAVTILAYLSIALFLSCRRGRGRGGLSIRLRNPADSGHHPAFLVYPALFLLCSVPMALGPMVLLAGASINVEYFMWAGAMVASNGWMDVLLWGCTMVLLAPDDIADAGLEHFVFEATPLERQYGNMVWVQGGVSSSSAGAEAEAGGRSSSGGGGRGRGRGGSSSAGESHRHKHKGSWWRLGGGGGGGTGSPSGGRDSVSDMFRDGNDMTSLSGGMTDKESSGGGALPGIQMETVTSVRVETESSRDLTRNPSRTGSMTTHSLDTFR